jgi:recombination protein RecT
MSNELVVTERTQEGFLTLAQNIIKNENRILSKSYDLPKAMTSIYTNLMATKTPNGKLAIDVCSNLSIKNAITFCLQNELSPSKSQGYFIPYGDDLKFMPSYFGLVKMAKDLCGVNIVSNVIREGEQADVSVRSDGVMIINHKPSIKCLNNKIIAVYSIATHIGSGRIVLTNIMSVEEAKRSWAKSPTGCKVGKEFEHEMLIRTSERRLAKHLINKSNDSMMISIANEDGTYTPIDESYLANPIETQYTIDAEFMEDDIAKESARFEPTEDDIITADDLKLDEIEPVIEAPDGAIEISYSEYKNNKDKYNMVKGSYNANKKTCLVEVIG